MKMAMSCIRGVCVCKRARALGVGFSALYRPDLGPGTAGGCALAPRKRSQPWL